MITLTYEIWPQPRDGTQDGPIRKTSRVETLHAAVDEAVFLKEKYGENLRYVDITQRIFVG